MPKSAPPRTGVLVGWEFKNPVPSGSLIAVAPPVTDVKLTVTTPLVEVTADWRAMPDAGVGYETTK